MTVDIKEFSDKEIADNIRAHVGFINELLEEMALRGVHSNIVEIKWLTDIDETKSRGLNVSRDYYRLGISMTKSL